jgi:hypothetical protein
MGAHRGRSVWRHRQFPAPAQSVLTTFTLFEASGSFTDRGTEGMAAWWKMPVAPVTMERMKNL